MATRRLAMGGPPRPTHQRRPDPHDFIVPPDIDPNFPERAIEAKLGRSSHQSNGELRAIKMTSGGQADISAAAMPMRAAAG
jgi:hypothetical protein